MSDEELNELFQMLENQGMYPELCDTEIPFFDGRIPCGLPTTCYEEDGEYVKVPKAFMSLQREFITTITGDSMCDAGFHENDRVWIETCVEVNDGDVVLASIDGELTLKSYFMDRKGQHWLLPRNKKFKPIKLDDKMDVRIWGRVKERLEPAPRMSYSECARLLEEATREEPKPIEVTVDDARQGIRTIAAEVKIARHWYAVFRVLVDKHVIGENGYDTFVKMVCDEVPEHEHLPACVELQRLAVQSFAKPVALWREDNAPVKGKRYYVYLQIAKDMENLLGAS